MDATEGQGGQTVAKNRLITKLKARHKARTLTKGEMHEHLNGGLSRDEVDAIQAQHPRPVTRADCASGPRPCPWAGCRYHLYLDVNSYGQLQISSVDIWDMEHTCALDVASLRAHTQAEVGKLLGLGESWVFKIERAAKRRLRVASESAVPQSQESGYVCRLDQAREAERRGLVVLSALLTTCWRLGGPASVQELADRLAFELLVTSNIMRGLVSRDLARKIQGAPCRYHPTRHGLHALQRAWADEP